MPEYIYICPRGHTKAVQEPMLTEAVHICPEEDCGLEMHRKPQMPAIHQLGVCEYEASSHVQADDMSFTISDMIRHTPILHGARL